MGLRTNQANGDQGLDWGQALLQSGPTEMEAPSPAAVQAEALKCPRCESTNTKFCYYNNYNKSQPRHFCKSCKRHWTKGGTLRNVPVGGCRKNKRPRVINSSAAKIGAAAVANLCPNFTQRGASNPAGDRQGGVASILYQALIRSSPSPSPSPLVKESTDGSNISIPPASTGSTAKEAKEKTIDSNSTGTITNPSPPPDRNPNLEFEFSNFEMNASLIPASYQSPINTYMDSMEESTVTTVNIDYPGGGGGVWLGLETGNCSSMELPNYWNWSEIEALASADDLNISWDEEMMMAGEEEKVKVKP